MNQPQPVIDTSSLASKDDNLPLALIAGLVAAAVGAGLWAVITVASGWQIGWMAVGVGFLVGIASRKLGNGSTVVFGIIGAVLSLAGCLAGNLLSVVGFITKEYGTPFLANLSQLTPPVAVNLLVETGSPMDLLFYGIAVYEGFKLSIVPAPEPQMPAAT
jgi:hypothetical protein